MEIVKLLISTQHMPDIDGETLIKPDLWEHVVEPVLHEEYKELFTERELYESFLVNPTGKFEIGGPHGRLPGSPGARSSSTPTAAPRATAAAAFSGKDPSKVDRSAAYAARYVAKNVVAAGLADRCEVQVAYAIGVAHPVSLMIETFGTGKLAGAELTGIVREEFDLRPGRDRPRPRPAPADLPEDRRLRPLRPRGPRLHLGAHRPRRRAARRGRARGAAPRPAATADVS